MRKQFLVLMSLLSFMACQKENLILDSGDNNLLEMTLQKSSEKVAVCHEPGNGNSEIITISIHAWPAHEAHGDAVDMDGDGYFDRENNCSEVDCDDNNAEVNPMMEELCADGVDNDCDGKTDESCPEATKLDYLTNFQYAETWEYSQILFNGMEVPIFSNPCFSTYTLAIAQDQTFEEYNEDCPQDPAKRGTFTCSPDNTELFLVSEDGLYDTIGVLSLLEDEIQLQKRLGPVNIDLTLVPVE